jgi:riboflavin kinase/FMN adenylyltransferase
MNNTMPKILENGCVATVGFFDGVHAGHRFLIDQVKAFAEEKNLPSVVFTFAVHPRKVLHSDYQPQLLTTFDEKLFQLQSTGIDTCIVLNFDHAMAGMTAYDFLQKILYNKYNVKTLVVGHDHRFGHNRTDGFEQYLVYGNEIGIEVLQAERYSTNQFSHVSSSEIRKALAAGNITIANALLSYPYTFRGIVTDGYKLGRKIGFPTANIEPDNNEKLLPQHAVYAVDVLWNNKIYRGMMNIGKRPTVITGNDMSIEVHIINFSDDIYNEVLEISFLKKIRDEQKFENIEALVKQLETDKITALNI